MNVLFVISGDLWAGAEVQTCSLIHALARTETFCLHTITFNEGVLTEKLHGEGISVTVLDEKKHSAPALVSGCLRVMRGHRPDIVHVNGFKENLLGGIAARIAGVRAVVRTHHGKGMIGASVKYNTIERINGRLFTDAAIAVSHDLKRHLVDFGLGKEKIAVIHNGIDLRPSLGEDKIESLRRDLKIEKGEKIVGTVGRLVPVKDHKTFIASAKLILENEPCTGFVIVGDGPLRSGLERQAREAGVDSRVRFTGFRSDAPELLHLFDVFALTSIHEGIPMALLEAMALGKPIVATWVGGVTEVVADKRSGLLVEPENPRSFADACIRVLRDGNFSKSLSEHAAATVKEKFTLAASVSLTQELYRRAIRP